MPDLAAIRERYEAATGLGCPLCTIEIDGDGNAVHEPDCTLADLPAVVEALENLEHQRNDEFDRAEIADCQLADAQMALEEAQAERDAVQETIVGLLPRIEDLERQLTEAQGKLERIESEGCTCDRGNPFACIVHDDQSVIARILKEGE